MSTIYRKYRPQIFADVTGQEHIIKTITNEIAANKIAHAYLFSGPRGIGKTTMARLLAKALNCQKRQEGEFEPCNECSSCVEITNSRNIDVIEIDAASHTGVDNVRENIIDNAQFKPTKSKLKLFIIDEVHMLSPSAFNALLKTLEEPPAHVIFILATTEPHKLPATIVSRCQRFTFKKVGYDAMLERLKNICRQEKIKVDKKVLERIINKSEGCVRDAESLLGQILSINLKNIGPEEAEMILPASNVRTVIQFIEDTINNQTATAINTIQQLVYDGINLEQFAYDIIEVLRVLMISQTDTQAKNLDTDYSEEDLKTIRKMAVQINPPRLTAMIESLISRRREIKSAPIPQLPLELFIINFTNPSPASPSPAVAPQNSADAIAKQTDSGPAKPPRHPLAQSIKATISHLTHPKQPIKTTLAEVKNKWSEVMQKLSGENHSLTFILKMCNLDAIDDSGLHISLPYSFHKDKLEEPKAKQIIERCLFDLFGEKIYLHCSVAGDTDAVQQELDKLAADFGGEVIN